MQSLWSAIIAAILAILGVVGGNPQIELIPATSGVVTTR